MTDSKKPVLIKCPNTDQEIPTGSWATEADWEADTSSASSTLACPACSETHTWSREDAFLGEA